MTTFTELGVMPEIAEALVDVGIVDAFPIQEMTLSVALMGTDLIGQARTGTGKTLAFAIPVIQRTIAPHDKDYDQLAAPGKPQALIVAPTRELAIQVGGDVATAAAKRGTRSLLIYGGVGYDPQLDALRDGVDIVIGTPGRLLDLVNRGALDLSHVKSVVLDEADEMLDLGFLPDVESLLSRTPETRQTMLFSATMPKAIVTLARKHMHHPMNIRAESQDSGQMVPTTSQFVWQAHEMDKAEVLARILQADDVARVIIFTRTKRTAQRVADDLIDRGFPAAPLHGDMAQPAREKALNRFREGKVNTLVATDVAARGIDVADISHVINYNCPEDDKTYVHRIGRTGRAGKTGTAVTFVDWADLTRWKLINQALDLPFEEPVEMYSTSDHLFQELGINREVKGRLKPPSPKEPRESDRGGNRGGGREGGRGGSGGGRPRQGSGQGSSQNGANQSASSQNRTGQDGAGQNGAGQNGAGSGADAPNRNRNRRRRNRTRSGETVQNAE